jgi:uncharacterized protein (DUF362 family)
MSQSSSVKAEVAIIKGDSPKEIVLEGIEKLGGISNYIKKDDQVFIKFNLSLPHGFPTNTNFDVLAAVIQACNEAGAKKVYVGSFPFNGMTIKAVAEILKLDKYIKSLGAELAYLDNSNYFKLKGYNEEQLKIVKNASFSEVEVEGTKIRIPNVVLNSEKLISINQVNVEPLFKCQLNLQSLFSVVQDKLQKNKITLLDEGISESHDPYVNNLFSTIFNIYSSKKPNLVINDLFYVLEGAGPYIYSDSKLKKTGIMVIGNDIGAVDMVTLKLLKIDTLKNELYEKAIEKNICPSNISEIRLLGEDLQNNTIDIELCPSKLEDINVRGFNLKPGKLCSGCFKQAYHLFNLMKTNMVKDQKYLSKNSFLIGINPSEPEYADPKSGKVLENILIFGDCAIQSTKDRKFRKITAVDIKKSESEILQAKIQKLQLKKIRETNNEKIQKLDIKIKHKSDLLEKLKKSPEKPKEKRKEKLNKNILEFPGCPPDLFESVESIVKYYGKSEVPTLNLFYKTIKSYIHRKMKKKLDKWEAL